MGKMLTATSRRRLNKRASKKVSPSHKDGTAQLVIKEAEPSSGGIYKLTVSNADGTDSADITLIVKSVPAAPEGPLEVSIGDKSCKLSWKPPANDGCSALLGYYVEKYDEKTKKWTFVARVTENKYSTGAPDGSVSVRYRVAAENAIGVGPFIESEPVAAKTRPSPPGRPTVQQKTADSVALSWTEPQQIGGSAVKQYTVEMCTVANKKWKKAESVEKPQTTLFNLVPTETYIFRVKASNAIGESEFSEESEPICLKVIEQAEAKKKDEISDEIEPTAIDYEKCDSVIDSSKEEDIDEHHLPNDLLAKYIICEELGQGAYGTVYRAVERATGKTWAAKIVQVRPGVKKDDVLHEISVMKQLHHEKLLHLHEAFDLGNEMCLIEEFVSGGELIDKVLEDDSLMSEEEARCYMKQILLGLAEMHSKQFVHLDLKPENILLKSKNSTDLKIIDFGLARKIDPNRTVKLLFGTPEFCAPEVVNNQPVSFSTDMWTVGVIAYVLLSGMSPFLGDTDAETLANVSAADWDFDDPTFDDVSDLAKDFICRLMCKDKRRRITVQQALQHPWITQSIKPKSRGHLSPQQKKKFMMLRRWSDDLLPIGRLAKRGAIFRQHSMDGVFERNISFDSDCPPEVKKQLEDIVAYVGDLIATLTCEVDGTPLPRISWYKDEKELSVPSMKYDSRFEECSAELTVKNIDESDSGTYCCRATNELGVITTEAKLTVKPKESRTSPIEKKKKGAKAETKPAKVEISEPVFDSKLSDLTATVGERVTLSVTSKSSPEVTVDWFHNGDRITEKDARHVQKRDKNTYELSLPSVSLEDEGKWKVIGKNTHGTCESECTLTVKIPDGYLAPVFENPLEDVNCEEMELLVLSVKIVSNPPPEITWLRDDKELQHSQNYRLHFDDDTRTYTLTIVKAYTEDSGEYKCIAKNAVGSSESLCSVRIKEPEDKRSKKIDESKAPKFSMHLAKQREAPENEELVLTCVVSGTPHPTITWLKDGKRVVMTGKTAGYDSGVCTLTIAAVSQADSGCYTCEAENIHGKAQSECNVNITTSIEDGTSAPKFVEFLTDHAVSQMDEILLECCFKGKPVPTITWYKDGQKLAIENRMLQYADRKGVARLNIMNCVPGDSGEYCCEAVNALGKDTTECRVKVTGEDGEQIVPSSSRSSTPSVGLPADDSRPPVITRPLVDTTVKEGGREILEMEVDGFPTPMVEWYHEGKLVAESRTVRSSFNGTVAVLKIYEAQPEHQGQYICKVSNKAGVAESRAMLIVEQESADQVSNIPVFIKKLQNVNVKELGVPISLSCQARGNPAPVIRWLHNGKSADDTSIYRSRTFDDGMSTLEILKISERLCGTYTAIATNPHGDAHSSADVVYQVEAEKATAPPSFIVEPKQKVTAEEDSPLTIVCDIRGSPAMEIVWMKNDRPLNESDRVRIERDGITFRLIIASATTEDDGVYTITAKDEFGTATAKTEVVVTPRREAPAPSSVKIVKAPPAAIEGELTVESITQDSISLAWNPPSDTRAIDGYKVEQRTPDQQTWTEVATVTRPKCVVKNLAPNTEYLFRVAVKNAHGESEGCPPAKARTLAAGSKPQFTELPPSALSVEEGDDLCILANFNGTPPPKVKWYKNGREMTESDGTISSDDTSSKLVIAKASAGVHDAVYSCFIENEMGQASLEVAVSIMVTREGSQEEDLGSEHSDKVKTGAPPSVAKPLNNETVQPGQQFVLSCRVTGAKDGTVAWYHNDDRVSSTGRYELLTASNGTYKLICHSSCPEDAGAYRCVVTNDKGMAQTECQVLVKDAQDQTAPVFEQELSDITVLTGKSVVLSCKASGLPEPELAWTKDGERIATSRRVRLEFGEKGLSELHIRDCTAQDAGIYLCTATNSSGVQSSQCTLTVAEISGKDGHLVIAEEEKIAKPRFIRAPPSTLDAQEGGQFKLVAKATGEPKPTITWKKDGREIQRTNRLYKTYLTGDGDSHLLAECVVSKTSGIFSCIAHNIHGEAVAETQVFVHKTKAPLPAAEKPAFSQHLKDTGVVTGHPVTLGCKVHGVPEPELKWFYVDDAGNVTCLTEDEHGWIECRGGEAAELKAECVLRSQQGTYKCVASNEHGQATSVCYLLVGDLKDERAGPPRFLRCLQDIWTPLGEEVVFEVEVAGYPAPELTWYHQDKPIVEGKTVKISYISETVCELRVSQVALRDLGTYAVEASNVHGVVRTTSSLNAGEPRHAEPPQFQLVDEPSIEVKPKVAFKEEIKKSASTVRMEHRKKGAPPVFLQGLEDMELEAGASAAVAGKLGRKHRHRHSGEPKGHKSAREDARGLAASIVAGMKIDEESRRQSAEEQKQGNLAMEEIRNAIQTRNQHMCRPKFIVKPKPKKVLEEFKSLRLKTAISANPTPTVHWDREGVVLETGNKYSIYNDGDFYYLEVHHVSTFDQGFYNCTASNSEGISTCTSEVEVVKSTEDSSAQQEKRKSKKELKAPAFIEVLPGVIKATACEPLSIECSVSGYPAPAIRWLRNGAPLLPNLERYVMSYDGECATLKFAFVSVADEGVYTCEAKNECGDTKAQVSLEIDPGESLSADGIPPLFRTEKVRTVKKANDGERVELVAELVQGSEPVQIRWIRNRVQIVDSESFQYVRNGSDVRLVIADAFPEDGGEYAVEARNQFGTARCIMRLDVHSHERSMAEDPPRIFDAPATVRVSPGEGAELTARVTGHPDPVIAWTKANEAITNSEKYTLSNDGDTFSLHITDVVRADAGKFSLTAVNVAGEAKATIELVVAEPTSSSTMRPRFTHAPVSVQSRLGQRVELLARFSGQPPAVCRWFKGDVELEDGVGGYTIAHGADSSTLSIVFLETEHIGEYLCTVRNPYGEDLANAMIMVEGSSIALPQRRSIHK